MLDAVARNRFHKQAESIMTNKKEGIQRFAVGFPLFYRKYRTMLSTMSSTPEMTTNT